MTTGPCASPVIGVAGWKNSGKTTLVTRLVEELSRRGLKVATVKHAHHSFQIDQAEADTAHHRRAGAAQVAVVSRIRWALITETRDSPEPDLADVLSRLDPCDVVIVEGYKRMPIPKIEVRRLASAKGARLADDPARNVIAIAADHAADGKGLPVYSLDDINGIADLIHRKIGR